MQAANLSTAHQPQAAKPGAEVKQLWDHAGFLTLGIGLITNGVQWFFLSILEPALTLYEIVGRTLPLTMAITILAVSYLDKREITGMFHPLALSALFAGCAIFTMIIGAADSSVLPGGQCQTTLYGTDCSSSGFDNWLLLPVKFVMNYWAIYGPKLFLSSMVTAGFVAYCIDRARRSVKDPSSFIHIG